jgi:hypothetical protein
VSDLDWYLRTNYLNSEQFASACDISVDDLSELVALQVIPGPSYVVTEQATVRTYVFGEMDAPGSTPGSYFHPGNRTWVELARRAEFRQDARAIREHFEAEFTDALVELNTTTWRLSDSFSDNGEILGAGLRSRLDSAWEHFLKGTFGLCVANPISAREIARKEILQEKLTSLTDNGSKYVFASSELDTVIALIDDYAASSMPFSPIEYPHSSRKRLVEDLRVKAKSA